MAYFSVAPTGGGGFGPPYGKSTSECMSPILFYTVTYTYIDSLNLRGQVSIFNDEVRSKFGRKLGERVENSKIRNLRCSFGEELFPRVA